MLTDTQIRGFRANGSRQDHPDGGALYLCVQPKGAKSWVLRPTVRGSVKRRTIGKYPAMSAKQARAEAARLKAELESSPDTSTLSSKSVTVKTAFATYMTKKGEFNRAGKKLKTADEKWRIFHADIMPTLGDLDISKVTRADLANLIESKAETAPIQANRIYALLATFFKWCTIGGGALTKLEVSPMARIEKPSFERARERYLDETEIKLFLKHVDKAGDFAPVYRTLLYLGLRASEPFKITRADVDGERATIRDTKNDLPFAVYLTETVRGFGFKAKGKQDDAVFALTQGGLRKAGARILKAMQEDDETVQPWTPHDLRRTMTTNLARFLDEHKRPLVPMETRKKMINHKDSSVTGEHYDRWDYFEEKAAGWQIWSNWLDELLK